MAALRPVVRLDFQRTRTRPHIYGMRIERTGPVEPLTPRVEAFLREALRGESMDDVQDTKELRIDYSCLGGLLAIELKALEDDGGDRMENLASELRERDDWPMFLGSAPIQSFIQHTNDPEGLNRRTLERIGRGVVNHLKKANRQLEAHCQKFPRRDTVRALVLVNEDHETYDPHTVSHILWHAVRQMKDGKLRYEHVDLIFYFTERHAQAIDNQLAFPTVCIECQPIGDAPWKADVAEFFGRKWAAWNDVPLHMAGGDIAGFEAMEHVPEQMTRSDAWLLNYRRQPYLRGLTKEALRDRFDEVTLVSMLWGLKGSPVDVPMADRMAGMQQFGDLIYEMGQRAIPITDFNHDHERALAAAARLGLPPHVIEWLDAFDAQRKG